MFLLVGTLAIVSAESTNNSAVLQPERIGFFENQLFKLKLIFTFNKEKKINETLDMAEKRLAEAELLANESPEAYKKEQERYDDLVTKAENILDDIKSDNENENASIKYMSKIARIQNRFERHKEHADEIYSRALERFESNNASDKEIERFEMFHERALNRSNTMEERAIERQKNAIRRYKALSNMSDEQLGELLEKIENNSGLTKAREVRKERLEKRFEKFEEIGAKRIERHKKRLENANNLTEKQRRQIEEQLEKQEGRFEKTRNRIQQRFENIAERHERRAENLRETIKNELEDRNSSSEDDGNESEDNETA